MQLSDSLGGPLAVDFVPRQYRAHRALRILLPFRDPAGELVSWRRFAPADALLPASLGWHDLLARAGQDPSAFTPADGTLDDDTAAALRSLVSGLQMTCLRAVERAADAADPVDVDGAVYARAPLSDDLLQPGARVPEFAWDAGARLAWGARPRPDSLVVAADLAHVRAVHEDPRLTATGVRTEFDALPPSAAG